MLVVVISTLARLQYGQYDFETTTTGVDGIASCILLKVDIVDVVQIFWMVWQ